MDMRHLPKSGGGCYVALDVDADSVLTVMVQDLMCEYQDLIQSKAIADFTKHKII